MTLGMLRTGVGEPRRVHVPDEPYGRCDDGHELEAGWDDMCFHCPECDEFYGPGID